MSDAEMEYSYIFMPDIWSLMPETPAPDTVIDNHDKIININPPADVVSKLDKKEVIDNDREPEKPSIQSDEHPVIATDLSSEQYTVGFVPIPESSDVENSSRIISDEPPLIANENVDVSATDHPNSLETATEESSTTLKRNISFLERIADLKVTELKAELEERDVKFNPKLKKAELVSLLKGVVQQDIDSANLGSFEPSDNIDGKTNNIAEESLDKAESDQDNLSNSGLPSDQSDVLNLKKENTVAADVPMELDSEKGMINFVCQLL